MVSLGIDLGTTNSCMAVIRNDKLEILANPLGSRITPSIIGFINDKFFIVNITVTERVTYAENVIYDVKRFIGLQYADKTVQNTKADVPYEIFNFENKIKILVKRNGLDEFYSPEELSAKVLLYLKEHAEKSLDTSISVVVITVPTYFNDSQRRATIDAGKIAGFTRVALLDEPTAAAIHYGIENHISDGRIILVFDFGGGTFDVSIIKYDNNNYEVLAIDGDTHLGGIEINKILYDYFIKHGVNIKNKRFATRFKSIVECAKIDLALKEETIIDFNEDEITFKRSTFNEITDEIIKKTLNTVQNCLKKLNNISVDHVVLVGGSSRIHRIEELLSIELGQISKQNVNKDEAVAAGAAIWAAKLFNNMYSDIKIENICPHSLGVEVHGGKMSFLIKQFTKLPTQATKRYKTSDDKQREITIKIYSGESKYTKNNTFLGDLTLSNIMSGPNGCILRETLSIDSNGILKVIAADESGPSKEMSLVLATGNLNNSDIIAYKEKCLRK